MSYEITKFYTWKCDIPNCKEKLTSGGDPLRFMECGWGQYEIRSFGVGGTKRNYLPETKIYLCPEHNKEFRERLGVDYES